MKILEIGVWTYYDNDQEKQFDHDKVGKWMYFFNDKKFVTDICKNAIEKNIVYSAKHNNSENGVACFYLHYDDIETHKKVISYFLENNLIKKTKTGRLYNISFKLDNQTRAGEYGDQFKSDIKLENFINLYTGEWLV